jgi:glycerol-3-phosphate dehydrogenase (NAD(P)+)
VGTKVKVAVIGAGAWGTTLASLLTARSDVRLWAREPAVVESIVRYRQNRPFLDGFQLPGELATTNRLDEALDSADVVVVAVPSQFLRATMTAAHPFVPPKATVVSAAKGIELHSGQRMTEVLSEVLVTHDRNRIGVLSGPNLAREIIGGQPAATCVAFANPRRAMSIQRLFGGEVLRVYTSDDVVGCEIGGAVKNVIAIAAGVADGLGFGTNTKAALITRGLAELTRLGVALGGRPLTFLGLAGNGDLIATCSSPLSRNRRFGEEMASGRSVEEMIGATSSVAEGVDTAPALVALAGTVDIEMPISNTVADLLRGDISPKDVVAMWMGRPPKPELHGLRA